MSSSGSGLVVTQEDHCATLRINRPERRNALDGATQEAMVLALSDAAEDPDVRVVVITGTGGSFCAGRDLKELNELARDGARFPRPMLGLHRNLYEVVLETPKPTIAAIDGPAVGGGCELALACDLRIASTTATFQLPEALRGMGANAGSVLAHRVLPSARAFEMLYLASRVDAQQALQWNLVNSVHEVDDFDDAVRTLAAQVAAKAPLTLRRYKEVAVKGSGLPLTAAMRLNMGLDPYASRDREEGVRAYVEGREPRWTAT